MATKKQKRITNLELLDSINRSFSKVEEKIDTKVGEVKKEIEGVKDQLAGTNKRIDDLAENRVKYEDHNKLKVRVDVIEKKLESKAK